MSRIVYTDMSGQERSVPFGAEAPVVTIGRATDCTIRSNRKSVSRRHAEFRYANGQAEIIDLNSSNGTYLIINDERKPVMGREFLAPNDEVWCGDFILHFVSEGEDDVPTHNSGPAEYQHFGGAGAGGGGGYDPQPYQEQAYDAGGYDAGGYDAGGAYDPVQPGGGMVFDSPNLAEASSVAWGQTEPPAPMGGPDHTVERSSDMERLKAEKQSIEELAARQAQELDELQSRLEEERRNTEEVRGELDLVRQTASDSGESRRLEAELSDIRDEKKRLEERLHSALQQSDRVSELERQLDEARRRNTNLESELDSTVQRASELEGRLSSSADVIEDHQRMREDALAKTRDIEALESEVVRLQNELDDEKSNHREARKRADAGARALEEADALKREVDRHTRLVEEFERRNRDLKDELEAREADAEQAKRSAGGHQARVDDLEAEIETSRHEIDRLKAENRGIRDELDALHAAGSVDDLQSEIEGLKQRLKLEKDRARNDGHLETENQELTDALNQARATVEELQGEIDVLRETVASAPEPPAPGSAASGLDATVLAQLVERVDALDRIVDAIERTDLDPLSTVDRVRLQSAIRDTEPKRNLQELKSILGGTE